MLKSQKYDLLEKIVETLQKEAHFAFITFEKTSHTSLEKLRKELSKSGAKLQVIKNTILEKALAKLSPTKKEMLELRKKLVELKATTALLTLGSDWSHGLKAFHTFIQKEKTLSFKLGFIENEVQQSADLSKLATLPSKNELLAKIIGSLKSPTSKFVYALKFNTNKFVYVLQEKAKKG